MAAEAPVPNAADDMALFESYMSGEFNVEGEAPESGFKRLSKGERIEATVIQVDRDKVFVDLGTKAEGIVPLGELSDQNLDTAKGLFEVGDKINVVVLRPEGAEGNPIVSKKRADFEEAWDRIERAFKEQETLVAQVVDRVKGGLSVDVGVRGFVPATHVGSGKLRNIEKFVGQELSLKVIEIDRERRKVVLSNRQAEEERKTAAKDSIFTNVKPGDTLDGTVRRLADYGAFVDLGGVDGLLHISEMSWARISHPKEMFKEGQRIKVMVLRLDPAVGKISLGHRQVLPDPWNLIRENYKIGQRLMVNVSRLVQSGAFIRLPEGAEAFMPLSEMTNKRVKRPQDVVEENQEVEVQIIDLRPEDRRMVLSMRSIGGGSELRPGATEMVGEFRPADRGRGGPRKGGGRNRFEDEPEEFGGSRRGIATGGATIGERLGALKGLLGRDAGEAPAESKPEPTPEPVPEPVAADPAPVEEAPAEPAETSEKQE
jgi:4-hydroxy-3-methylbut-2-enyl diphosphate reductase